MNDGQWTAEEHEAHLYKAGEAQNVHAWNREARAEAERHNQEFVQSMADWRTRVEGAGFKVHPAVPHGHLQRVFPLCVCFQMSMKLFVNMIPPRLQLHSRYFQRKPLQQQAEAGQQDSTQKMSLQGLDLNHVQLASASEASRIYLQPLEHNHLVHLSKPFPNQPTTSQSSYIEASSTSTSSAGSAQQASATQGISRSSTSTISS